MSRLPGCGARAGQGAAAVFAQRAAAHGRLNTNLRHPTQLNGTLLYGCPRRVVVFLLWAMMGHRREFLRC